MGDIKAGVVIMTKFCKVHSSHFTSYIDYIDREEASRTKNSNKYNLYQDYMGNPEKTTGLFHSEKNELTMEDKRQLKDIFKTAQENGSLMWQTVISFDNRWLEQNGLYSRETQILDENKLKDVARNAVNKMLKAEGLENAVWSGAIHYNTDNIHIHIATVEPEPMREKKEYIQYQKKSVDGKTVKVPLRDAAGNIIKKEEFKGRFRLGSIESCKSSVVNQIINEKENNLQINRIIRDSIIKQKKEHPLSKDKELAHAFLQLYDKMPDCARNMWNYNNPIMAPVKEKIDLLSDLYLEKYHKGELEELQSRLQIQNEKYKVAYGENGKSYAEGKKNDMYTRLGNVILKEIREYDKELKSEKKREEVNYVPPEPEEISFAISDSMQEKIKTNKAFEQYEEMQEGDIREASEEKIRMIQEPEKIQYEWSQQFKEAKKNLYGKKPDYEKAIQLLEEEHTNGNVLATYELGDVYRFGRGTKIDIDMADRYYQQAFSRFQYLYRNEDKGKGYFAYRIGKHFYYGQGIEKSYENAREWMEKSGNKYATYLLGKMAYYGQGIKESPELAFQYFTSISHNNAYAAYQAASMIENQEISEGAKGYYSAEELYASAFHRFLDMERKQKNDNLEYKIGLMYLNGKGVGQDAERAEEYLSLSADAGNIYAKSRLAKLYLEEGREERIPQAVAYLSEVAIKGKSDMAMYTLGNIYSSEKYTLQDLDKAKEWYNKAEKAGNTFASYKLGKMYYEQEDFQNAAKHYEKCDNRFADYFLGKIYLDEQREMYDIEKGLKYMTKAAMGENEWAQYQLGNIYCLDKYGIQDIKKAYGWYTKAEQHGNEFASYKLGKICYDLENYSEAVEHFEKCNNQYANYYLGKIYLDEEKGMFNPDKGLEYLTKAAMEENEWAQYQLGNIYCLDKYGIQDIKKAYGWYTKAEQHGNEFASYKLGKICYDLENYSEAVEHFEKCNNQYANYYLGKIYLDEEKGMFNPDKGLEYLTKAAMEENEWAQYQLGNIYDSDQYGMRDNEKAFYWYGKAEDHGNEIASYKLGELFYGQERYEEAAEHFEKCGNQHAKYYLGKIYLDKKSGMYDVERGIDFLTQAAKEGNSYAEFTLGMVYFKGDVVQRDLSKAKDWFIRSAEHENEYAKNMVEGIERGRANRALGIGRGVSLATAINRMKRGLKSEWEKQRNIREHERLMNEYNEGK